MRIGNKIFPYPILNSIPALSGYNESSRFKLIIGELKESIDKKTLAIKDVRYSLENDKLNELANQNILKCTLLIECSSTLYRNHFNISSEPIDIKINTDDINNMVTLSAFLYADEEIFSYQNNEFNDDYDGYKFNIEKRSILAVDESYSFSYDHNPEENNKVASIFTIVKTDSLESVIDFEDRSDKINIFLPNEYYMEYDLLKNSTKLNNIMFSMLVIPVLSRCLDRLKLENDQSSQIDDLIEQKRWFRAVVSSFEKIENKKLNVEDFFEIESLVLAQKVLNNATCTGLKDFSNIINNYEGNSEDDE